jgi:hypothetical protein
MRTPISWIRVAGLFVALLLLCMTRADVQAWGERDTASLVTSPTIS